MVTSNLLLICSLLLQGIRRQVKHSQPANKGAKESSVAGYSICPVTSELHMPGAPYDGALAAAVSIAATAKLVQNMTLRSVNIAVSHPPVIIGDG